MQARRLRSHCIVRIAEAEVSQLEHISGVFQCSNGIAHALRGDIHCTDSEGDADEVGIQACAIETVVDLVTKVSEFKNAINTI